MNAMRTDMQFFGQTCGINGGLYIWNLPEFQDGIHAKVLDEAVKRKETLFQDCNYTQPPNGTTYRYLVLVFGFGFGFGFLFWYWFRIWFACGFLICKILCRCHQFQHPNWHVAGFCLSL
jgi:hypothetical protein